MSCRFCVRVKIALSVASWHAAYNGFIACEQSLLRLRFGFTLSLNADAILDPLR